MCVRETRGTSSYHKSKRGIEAQREFAELSCRREQRDDDDGSVAEYMGRGLRKTDLNKWADT